MHHNGARNIALLTGFLARAEAPGVRRLYQSAAADAYLTILVGDNCTFPDMAPVDLSGPVVPFGTEFAVRADYLEAATEQSIYPTNSFHRLGKNWQEIAAIDFRPTERSVLKPEIIEQLRKGVSDWGVSGLDEMTAWPTGPFNGATRKKVMNRVLITGSTGNIGEPVASGEMPYHPTKMLISPGGERIETRMYADMRFGAVLRSATKAARTPITVKASIRGTTSRTTGARGTYLKVVDLGGATVEDFVGGVPEWLRYRGMAASPTGREEHEAA